MIQRLHVLTREDPPGAVPTPATVHCDGTHTCLCPQCETDRTTRMRSPRRPTPQPWESKAA